MRRYIHRIYNVIHWFFPLSPYLYRVVAHRPFVVVSLILLLNFVDIYFIYFMFVEIWRVRVRNYQFHRQIVQRCNHCHHSGDEPTNWHDVRSGFILLFCRIAHFPIALSLLFNATLSVFFHMKTRFHSHANRVHFHRNGLALIERLKATWKWALMGSEKPNGGFAIEVFQPGCMAGKCKSFALERTFSHRQKNLLYLPCNMAAVQNLYTFHRGYHRFEIRTRRCCFVLTVSPRRGLNCNNSTGYSIGLI